MKNFVTKYAGSVGKRYKWLALASAVWLRGVSMVFGAPPTTVDWDTTNLTPLPAVLTEEKDTLIFSDSPEYVEKSGVVAAGTVDGTGRIYYYHVNEMDTPQKMALVLENKENKPVKVTVHRAIYATPNADYFAVGRELSLDELTTPMIEGNYKWKLANQHVRSLVSAGVPLKSEGDEKEQKRFTFGSVPEFEDSFEAYNMNVADDAVANANGEVTSSDIGADNKNKMPLVVDKERFKQIKSQISANRKALDKRAHMDETVVATYEVPPLGRIDLFPKLDKIIVLKDQLTSGIVDFTTDGPVWAKVMMIPHDMPVLNGAIIAETLPMDDVELRGTYFGAQRRLMLCQPYDTLLGPVSIMVANDREDPFVAGVDELTRQLPVTNRGNYGVTYTLSIPTIGTDEFAVYFNPLGGAYSGSFRLTYGEQTDVYTVPNTEAPYLGNGTIYDTQYLDTFKGGQTLTIQFIPAGASNLPVQFLLIPLKHKSNK